MNARLMAASIDMLALVATSAKAEDELSREHTLHRLGGCSLDKCRLKSTALQASSQCFFEVVGRSSVHK